MRILYILTALLFISNSTFSQGINIFDIDTINYPIIKAKFYAYDKDGKIQSPTKDQLKIIENGTERKIIDVSCPEPTPKKLSICVMVDTYKYIELARSGTEKLIDLLDMQREDEIAITYMNGRASIWQDFTQDEKKATGKAKSIPNAPGVDVNTMFYSEFTGGVPFIKDRKADKRVLILVSDLHCPNLNIDEAKLIADAKKYNISIYSVLLGTTDYSSLFKRIADATQGHLYENVKSLGDINNTFKNLIIKENNIPCDITWESGLNCNNGMINLILNYQQFSSSINFRNPQNSIFNLEFNPKINVVFKNKEIGKSYDTIITVKAINSSVDITNITSTNPLFDINPKTFTLKQNETKELTITYTPIDNKYNFTKFEFTNSKCTQTYITSAYSNRVQNSSLRLTHPNGGEKFVVGSDSIITWEGISNADIVKLEYSTNSGNKWLDIDTARDLQYFWKNIPFPTSDLCLVRVNQIEDKNNNLKDTIRTLNSNEHQSVYKFIFSPDGRVMITNNIHVWDFEKQKYMFKLGYFYDIPIGFSTFSPDVSLIATIGKEIALWGGDDFNLIKTFNICEEGFSSSKSLEFSPDGLFLLYSCGGEKKLLNIITGQVENNDIYKYYKEFNGFDWGMSSAIIPNTNRYLTMSSNSIRIIDTETNKLLYEITTEIQNSDFRNLSINPKGNIFATGLQNGTIKFWDVETGNLIRTIIAHNETGSLNNYSPVNSIAFSIDGNTIVSCGLDANVKLWDVETGSLIKSHNEHQNSVDCVVFSPDGNTIVSGAWGPIKLWDINIPSIQSDQSDNVFSIIAPEPQFQKLNIDMGKVMVGASKDTMVTAVLCNIGEAPLHVLGVDVSNGDASEFMVPRGAGDFFLPPNECRDMMFAFMPCQVGNRNAQITVRSTIGDFIDTINITGEGIEPMVQVVNNFIDFGKVKVNENKDSLQAHTIKNIGSTDLKITKIYQFGPNLTDFKEINDLKNYTLKSGEELKLDLSFKPTYLGRTNGTLMFEYDGIGSPAVVQLFGEGIPNNPNCDGRGFVFDNFHSKSNVTLVGSAELTQDSTIRLTDTKSNLVGGVTYGERMDLKSTFEMKFSFHMSNGNNNQFIDGSLPGADGFAVLFQNGKNFRTTANGGSLGFNGIENCVALEIDMYKNDNPFFDPNGNHIALQVPKDNIITAEHNASRTVAMNDQIFELRPDSTVYYGKLVYDAEKKLIQFFLDSTNQYNNLVLTADNFDFSQYLLLELGDFAHIGITSTTGAATQIHELLSWEFCSERDEFLSVEDRYYESEEVKQIENILKLESGNIKEIEVMDITGKVLINKDINNNEINLNELGISTGIYFIILKDDQNRSHFRKVNLVR